MSPKAKAQLAREHLERALPAVEAGDSTEAVMWLFAALEAAITAIAEGHGIAVEPKHWAKTKVAKELFARGELSLDLASTLHTLNEARKIAVYDGEEPDFGERSLEDVAADVERSVRLAEGSA
jgi:HEPN domain-containing protein